MRKFLVLAAVVGLALLTAVPAMALDFKFGAEYRVRFYDAVNLGFEKDSEGRVLNTNPRGVQVRIRPRFDVTDDNGNMTATLRLEIGDTEFGNGGGASCVTNAPGACQIQNQNGNNRVGNGSGGSIGNDGVNVETKWAYVDFASPFGIPLRWRAGLQPWYLPKGILVDDDAAGVRAYGKAGIVSYELAWWRVSGGQTTNTQSSFFCTTAGVLTITTSAAACTAGGGTVTASSTLGLQGFNQYSTSNARDDNFDYYQAKVDLAVAPWLNPGVYALWGDNKAASTSTLGDPAQRRSSYYLGATITGNATILTYDLDLIWGSAKGGPNGTLVNPDDNSRLIKAKGWMADGGVHIPVGPLLIHFVGSYASGDKQNGGNSEAFPSISPGWNGAGGLYELIGSGGPFDAVEYTQDFGTGLWMLGGGVEYRPVKALWLKAMYGFAGFTNKRANCAYSNGKSATQTANCFGPSYFGKGYNSTDPGAGGVAGKAYLGQELSLRADYDLWTNFKIQSEAGWLFPSKGDVAHEYVLQLLYSF